MPDARQGVFFLRTSVPLEGNGRVLTPGRSSSSRICVAVGALPLLCLAVGCGNSTSSKPSGPVFSIASLNGNYTYRLDGNYLNSTGSNPYQEGGTFVADGKGNITGGVDDFVENSTLSSGPLTGTYTVASDGTGEMTLNLARGTVHFAFALASASSLYVMQFDSFAAGDGVALQQVPSVLSVIPAGTFIFHLHATRTTGAALGAVASIGQMTVQNGAITGTADMIRAGVPGSSAITGSMTTPDANGRGTAILTDDAGNEYDYTYYVVDSSTLKLLETDPGAMGGGRADAQSNAPFSNATLKNGFSFHVSGATLTNSFGANCSGAFVSDGNGNITSGSSDSVQDGDPASSTSLTGTYSVASNGRATITLNPAGAAPSPLIAWMVSSSYGYLLVDEQDLAEDGHLDQQQDTPFSAASLNGRYAFYSFGSQSPTSQWTARVGVMTFDGQATVTFNDYFANHSGLTAQNGPASGSYFVSSNGRVVAFTVGVVPTQVIYLISNSSANLILGASGSEYAGSIEQQSLQ